MELQKADIGVVIINYNNSLLTKESVRSVLAKTSSAITLQIVVVDNASEKEDYVQLVSFISQINDVRVKLVRSVINTGFGGGNMFGVQHLNATYYAFINNDTLLQNDCLAILKTHLEANSQIALCGPQILDENLATKVSFDHFVSLTREVLGSGFLELINAKKYPNRKKEYADPLQVNYVNGSFMFCRVSSFNEVGGFDTNLFLFFEESDLSYRMLEKGLKTSFVPKAKYIHFQGKSMPNSIETKLELKTSMFYVIRKHQGYLTYQLLRLLFIIRYGLTSIIKPKYWPLFYRVLIGLPLSKSLKTKQLIVD